MSGVGASPAFAAATISTELQALIDKVGLDQPIIDVFVDKGILDPLDVTLIGDSEKEYVDALSAAVGAAFDPLTSARRAKKLRALCAQSSAIQSLTPTTPSVKSSAPDHEEPLPDGVPEAIEQAWAKRHNFNLSGHRILIGSDFNRIYNCLIKKRPREVPKMDPEKMRLTAEGITGESKGLFLSESGTVTAKKSYYAEIVAHDQLWWRIRAFLSTMSYVCILIDGFFTYQHCENFSDALHDVILAPSGNNKLPISQCKVAWKNMISAIHVKVHQSGCSLGELTENEMFWKVHWCWQAGPRAPPDWAPETPQTGNSSLVQSLMDQNANLKSRLGNRGGRGSGGRRRNDKGQGNGKGGDKWFNRVYDESGTSSSTVPPPPPPNGNGRGKGLSAGQKAWNKRPRNGQKGK